MAEREPVCLGGLSGKEERGAGRALRQYGYTVNLGHLRSWPAHQAAEMIGVRAAGAMTVALTEM